MLFGTLGFVYVEAPKTVRWLDQSKGDSKNEAFVQKVADANVHLVMRQVRERSPILRQMLDEHQIGLVGGMYDLKTGRVTFYSN